MSKEIRKWPVIGVVLGILWLFVRDVPLTVGSLTGELIIGLTIGMGLAYVLRNMYAPNIELGRIVTVSPYVAAYLASFLKELILANISVLKLVLSPSMPIKPAVIEVPLRVRSDSAITLIANSITLTPGTLTLDYNAQNNSLYVHAIKGQNQQAVLEPIRRWEKLALVIFNEQSPKQKIMEELVAARGVRA